MIGQYVFGDSLIHRLDARAKLFGFIILTAAIITASSPAGYLPVIAAVAVVAILSRLPLKTVTGSVIMLSRFMVIIFILNAAFFSAEEPIWQWWIISISYEGIRQGINVVFSLVLIITYVSLIVAMLAGRVVAGLARALIFAAGEYTFALWVSGYFVTSLPGAIIQLAFIPTIIFALMKARLIPERYPKALAEGEEIDEQE